MKHGTVKILENSTASSVTSPSSSNPPPSNSASNVTSPTTGVSSPTSPATNPSNPDKPAAVSSPANSTTTATTQTPASPAISSPTNGTQTTTNPAVSSPANGTTTATTQTPASNPISSPAIGTTGSTVTPLQAPSQAAPSGVAVTASSVSSPNSAPNVPTTTAISVTSPNASVSSPSAVSSVSSPSSSSAPSSVNSVTPPVSSVKPVGTSTVKPLGLTAGQIAGVKAILQDIYGPAMSLSDNAELSEKATQLMLDDIEARSQQEVADQTADMYLRTGQCSTAGACQKKAEEDVKAIFEYQDVMGMSQQDRIKMNVDLAVGLYTGATDKNKFEGIRHDAAWTVNTTKACEKNGQLGADCNKLNNLAKGGAFKAGGKMDLANRANGYLGKESKALVNGAQSVAGRHIKRAYSNWCNKTGTGDSGGLQLNFDIDLGVGVGFSAQFSMGIGIFNERGGLSLGSFVTGGGTFANGSSDNFSLGAALGVGVSGFGTNAGKAEELNGWAATQSINTPIIGVSSAQSGSVKIDAVGVGLGGGASVTSYDTLTTSGTLAPLFGKGC